MNFDWEEPAEVEMSGRDIFPGETFVFCRIKYRSYNESRWSNFRRGRWSIDYPESDRHFSYRLSELTTIDVERDANGEFRHAVVELTDDTLFNYPFIYIIEPGALLFSDEEAARLREYLLRGGFLMVDDFWGEAEWMNWEEQFGRVLDPVDYKMRDIDLSHPIFNIVFRIEEKPQVPSEYFWSTSGRRTSERGRESDEVNYKGVFDRDGRLMVVVCHNTDLGDGWEREGVNRAYFEEVSVKKAYPMGINIVVYALTH